MVKSAVIAILFFSLGFIVKSYQNFPGQKLQVEQEENLDRYSIENLSKLDIKSGRLVVKKVISDKPKFTSYLISFNFKPDPESDTSKTTTGMLNIPKNDVGKIPTPAPLVVMIRGFVDEKLYKTGMGSRQVSEFFANNGFITISLDFLGYGESDSESDNIFEARFQTYTTVLSLLKTLDNIDRNQGYLDVLDGIQNRDNISKFLRSRLKVFIWGHSNGGQIALTVLEIAGKNYPSVLWAPVSKPFPFNILYFSDEAEDGGKFIRNELYKFERQHDANRFSATNYLDKINAPLLIIHGGKDKIVPIDWSRNLYQKLSELGKNVQFVVYENSDHNLQPEWILAAQKSLDFFLDKYKNI
jgi:alpha-beta hydrolase superfamily lysophospholipase